MFIICDLLFFVSVVLVSPKERGPVEATLSSLPSLISRGSPDLPDVSVELARALLHLHDDWDIDSFTTLRHSSLVALTTSTPQLLAPFLTTEFYSPNHNLRQRSVILEVTYIPPSSSPLTLSPHCIYSPLGHIISSYRVI